MLDFEDSIHEPSRRSIHQVAFKEEYDEMTDLDYSLASVTASNWEAIIDDDESSVFAMPLSVEKYSIPSSNFAFYNDSNIRVEISKLSESIVSCNVSSEAFSVFDIDKPSIF